MEAPASKEELGGGLLTIIRWVSAKILLTHSMIAPTKRVLTILLVIDDFHLKVSGKVKNYSRVMRGCESNDFIMGGVKLGIRLYRWWC